MSQATHDDDTFVISSSTALGMAEYLLALLNTVVQNLPASDLRRMRNAMDQSVTLIDDLLYSISISSTFDTLTISDASTALSFDGSVSTAASSHTPGRVTTGAPTKTTAPPPSPASTVNRDAIGFRSPSLISREAAVDGSPVMVHNKAAAPKYGIIISTRPRVGRPDYSLHPAFVQPGIPGPYLRPPVAPSKPDPPAYYVITKGLYVGIFCSWNECSPWVTGIPRNAHLKVRQWAEAKSLYNARLEADACEVLS